MVPRVLFLEDNEDDVLLVERHVQQQGLEVEWVVVQTLTAFQEALASKTLDLLLLDYHLEGFDGSDALKLIQASGLDLPALLVTGTLGEEKAAEIMRMGAADLVLKEHLVRLVPAMKRELEAARVRRLKQAQKAENRLLNLAMAQTPDAIMITDLEGSILYANPALLTLSGYSQAEVLGQNPRLFKSGRHDQAFYESMWSTLKGGATWRGRLFNRRKDGSLWEQQIAISPVYDDQGHLQHYLATARDITHEAELENRVAQTQRLETIGVLTGGIAHDFNNILMPVLGYAELGLQRAPGDPKVHHDLEVIQASAQRAAELVKQLLSFARKSDATPAAVELQVLVKESLRLLRATLPTTVVIEEELQAATFQVEADPTQLHQVILNLCINAGHAMRGLMGRLRVSLRQEELPETACAQNVNLKAGSYLVLEVADTGRGIAPEHLESIFLPFFTTKGPGEGTGLGLSITSGIVHDLGGGIQVQSTLGVGTTFKVYLPLAAHPGMGSAPASPQPSHGQERILLVDDEPTILEALGMGLRGLGYSVLSFGSPTQALEVLKAVPFVADLLVTDFTMPELTGLDLAREALKVRPDLRVILMSGYGDQVGTEAALAGGCAAFLTKPIGAQALSQAIRQVLGPAHP